jgi:REP element-mobilizing transposase RayT
LLEVWRSLSDWKVSRYVLMPNHLHLFAWPSSGPMNFDRWVTAWKAEFSCIAKNRALRWQARCFNHRIQSWESAEAKYRYVLNNPVRHGLVSSAEEWPYQGELFPMKDWW